jgi:hypothetical protein
VPNRNHQATAPRWICPAAWQIPTDRAPWSVYAEDEAPPSPPVITSKEWLGREFDPTCPQCGNQTEEGRIVPHGERYLVQYLTCGHEWIATLDELKERTLAI